MNDVKTRESRWFDTGKNPPKMGRRILGYFAAARRVRWSTWTGTERASASRIPISGASCPVRPRALNEQPAEREKIPRQGQEQAPAQCAARQRQGLQRRRPLQGEAPGRGVFMNTRFVARASENVRRRVPFSGGPEVLPGPGSCEYGHERGPFFRIRRRIQAIYGNPAVFRGFRPGPERSGRAILGGPCSR